jgi:hypothetical protein
MRHHLWLVPLAACLVAGGCESDGHRQARGADTMTLQERLAQYTTVRLETDLSGLSEAQRRMIGLLIEAAGYMDDLFWVQAWGSRQLFMEKLTSEDQRRFAAINYGPWDRLNGDRPWLEGTPPKPPGANLYPPDLTKEEFEAACAADPAAAEGLRGLYTVVDRDPQGRLRIMPYHVIYRPPLVAAADRLRQAADLSEDAGFARYLRLRADALVSDNYQPSDLAWMDNKNNRVELVIGPIETYEDQLFGYKAAFEAFVLLKDPEWSRRLERYAGLLPTLQRRLPVAEAYKQESPGDSSDLNVYDLLFVAGDSNAGSKTIAINLPNDPEVQLRKGARRLQLKNAMRAKFDRILVPISELLIDPAQRRYVTFDAFFANTMFHEVAHGLGIKTTLNGRGPVREAMKEQASALEEGKADIVGLFLVEQLREMGEITDGEVMDNYVTFFAGLFRAIRFGASSAHGRANLARYNFFRQMGAFTRDGATGTYRVDEAATRRAIRALSERIILLQGDGDYEGAVRFMEELGVIDSVLQGDLDRVGAAGIPVDVVFEQGKEVLGLGH